MPFYHVECGIVGCLTQTQNRVRIMVAGKKLELPMCNKCITEAKETDLARTIERV